MYHRVTAERTLDPTMRTGPDDFADHVRYLARHFELSTVGELPARLAAGLDRDLAVITFDDGYRDIYDNAFPILRAQGAPATLFLTTGYVGAERTFWWERADWIAAAARRGADLSMAQVDPALHGALSARGALRAALCAVPDDAKEEALGELERVMSLAGLEAAPASPTVDWGQVHEMSCAGVEIGAHTIHHPVLTRVSPARARDEIAGLGVWNSRLVTSAGAGKR